MPVQGSRWPVARNARRSRLIICFVFCWQVSEADLAVHEFDGPGRRDGASAERFHHRVRVMGRYAYGRQVRLGGPAKRIKELTARWPSPRQGPL